MSIILNYITYDAGLPCIHTTSDASQNLSSSIRPPQLAPSATADYSAYSTALFSTLGAAGLSATGTPATETVWMTNSDSDSAQ